MSSRHTKKSWVGPAYDGLAFVPSMGFVGSVMPGGRRRASAMTEWRWINTSRYTGLGTEICTPLRFNVPFPLPWPLPLGYGHGVGQ